MPTGKHITKEKKQEPTNPKEINPEKKKNKKQPTEQKPIIDKEKKTKSSKNKSYKEKQRESMIKYVVDGIDDHGNTITKIFYSSDEYIIYGINTNQSSNSIKIHIESLKENDTTLVKRFGKIQQKFTKIKGLLYKVNDNFSIRVRIAYIIAHALDGNEDDAINQFDELIIEINNEYSKQFKDRLYYILTILALTLVAITVSIYIFIEKAIFIDFPEIRTLLFITTSGCIGSFLSVSRRLKDTYFEKGIETYLYLTYGLERVFISVFSAVVVYFIIKSNLMLGMINELSTPIYGYLIFAVIAGFSETMLPNLLIKLEKDNL